VGVAIDVQLMHVRYIYLFLSSIYSTPKVIANWFTPFVGTFVSRHFRHIPLAKAFNSCGESLSITLLNDVR